VSTAAVTRARVPWADISAREVADLYDDYAALLDDMSFGAWLELFTEDATYMVLARENVERGLPLATMRCDSRAMLADRLDAIVGSQFFARRLTRHLVSAVRPVATEPGAVEVTANFVVVETIVDEASTIHSAGTYADRIVRTDDGLCFAAKTAIYDAPLVSISLIIPL